jgi:molybdenum cofactor cytidylyltransferase
MNDTAVVVVGVVILAAGRSRRMGRPKMLLPWGQTTVLGHLIRQWQELEARHGDEVVPPLPRERENPRQAIRESKDQMYNAQIPSAKSLPAKGEGEGFTALRQVAVVCAEDDAAIAGELNRLRFPAEQRISNPDTERGMFSSIQCAARWNGWQAELTHWVLVLGDQPHLSDGTLRRLLDFAAEHAGEVCQPIYKGHRRHPVVMPKKIFRELADSAAHDLKHFLSLFAGATCEVDDPGLELDMDVPEDYERARGIYGGK